MFATDKYINLDLKNEKVVKYLIVEKITSELPPMSSVIEIGCGGGTMIRTLASRVQNRKYIGYDTDREAIFFAQKDMLKNLVFVDKIGDAKFDLIFMIDVLEHIENPKDMFDMIKKHMNSDARILIHMPLEKSGIYAFQWFRKIKSINSDHIRFYNYSDLKKIVEENGFEILKSYHHYHIISGLRDFLKYFMFSKKPSISKLVIYTQNWYCNMKFVKWLFYVLDFMSYYETILFNWVKLWSSGTTVIMGRK